MARDRVRICVTAKAFSQNKTLRDELLAIFPNSEFNLDRLFDPPSLIEYLHDAAGAIIGLEQINERILQGCPNLKIVAKYGVGLDNIDLAACEKSKVKVGWKPGVNKTAVAEMTVGFMIALSRNLFLTSNQLKSGTWNKSGGSQLSELTVGLIGVGNIGKEVVRLLKPFGCRILVNDIIDQSTYYRENDLIETDKAELFRTADIVSLHVPLSEATRDLMNRQTFAEMKKTGFFINTSRGPVVDQGSLEAALREQVIAGAAIDVYASEPCKDWTLLSHPNLICTPHTGGNSLAAVLAMGRSAIDELQAFFPK